jgi:hypothetical protein
LATHVGNETALHGRQLVGEFAATGDVHHDRESAVALLREKGLYRKLSIVQAVFRQAVSFANTASYLYKNDLTNVPRNGLSIVPLIVNSAFALELYLKTLGHVYGKSLHGHDLLRLFHNLPQEAHEALHQNFAKSAWQCGVTRLGEFRRVLEESRRAFVEWRYLHEVERVSGEIRIQPMIFVMEVLHETCRASNTVNHASTPFICSSETIASRSSGLTRNSMWQLPAIFLG